MALKFVILCSLLAAVSAGILTPIAYAAPHKVAYAHPATHAVASTHENVVRSFGGTVSQYSKAIDTPYASVRKEDTRISNNVYAPAIGKVVTYAAPTAPVHEHHDALVASKAVYVPKAAYSHEAPVYSHGAPIYSHAAPIYSHAAPAIYAHAAPAIAKSVTYAAPIVTKTAGYAAPAVANYNHGPAAASTYTHSAPGVAAYGSSRTVHYSPAEMVSHMSFDGFGTHWGW